MHLFLLFIYTYLHQWLHDSPLLQLRYLTEASLKPLARRNVRTLRQLASLSMAQRREIIQSEEVWPTLDRLQSISACVSDINGKRCFESC